MAGTTDIYSRQTSNFGGALSADGAALIFSNAEGNSKKGLPSTAGVGLLTQQLQLSYAQQITRLFEVGSPTTYYVAGRAQGQLALSRVVGPRPVQLEFYKNYGDVCEAGNNNITLALVAGCDQPRKDTKMSFLLRNVVLTSIGLSTSSENNVINENLQAMIVSLAIQS